MLEVAEPAGGASGLLDEQLIASVPPLLTPPLVKWASAWDRRARRVRPRRATSGIGLVGNF